MTQLYELYLSDLNAAKEKIQGMDTALLFAELDDTLQFDVLKKGNIEWMEIPELKLYRAIVAELKSRCR